MIRKITAVVFIFGVVAMAFAASTTPTVSNGRPMLALSKDATDCHFTEKSLHQLDENGNWQALEVGGLANRARAWSYVIDYADSCNKVNWPVSLKNEVAVAQWMVISMNNDGFHWAVRKPGNYVADCVALGVRSNYAVEVSCTGFDDLRAVDGDCIDSVIEVKYAFSDQGDVPPAFSDPAWCTPEQMNEMTWRVEDSYDLHWVGDVRHIWSTINVSPCNGPTEYVDRDWATITVSLTNQQPWIDPETGLYSGIPEFPFQQ